MQFHPAVQIMTWCLLVTAMQPLGFTPLLIVASLILIVTLKAAGHKFFQLLRRTRWIMVSLLLVYAFTTPGQTIVPALGLFSPSIEGLMDGVLQLTRLLTSLGFLALLLERLHRHQLIAGLYTLLAPVKWIGLSRERLAVRLALTLHYAEVAMLRGRQDGLKEVLSGLMVTTSTNQLDMPQSSDSKHPNANRVMELPMNHFTVSDAFILAMALIMLWMAWR